MKKKLFEHILSIIFVSIILLTAIFIIQKRDKSGIEAAESKIESYLNSDFINLDDPLNKLIFKETLNYFHPNQLAKNDSLIESMQLYRSEKLLQTIDKARNKKGINSKNLYKISLMYLKFISIYLIVLLFSYYGVQTIGTYRFIKRQQNRSSYLLLLFLHISNHDEEKNGKFYLTALNYTLKALIKGVVFFILFSPAYILAYSFKTEINTSSALFMILLGIISNGMLILYSNKFYTFLITESRKGYIQNAIVKNLNNDYTQHSSSTISIKNIFSFRKDFHGHVFQQIFSNAHYQYLSSFKEQASFLISSLIIIEMALNIQGFLSYELLQEALYKNYSIAILIVLGIFYIVKLTDITADWILFKEIGKYENKTN
jgi:hypothetical protein